MNVALVGKLNPADGVVVYTRQLAERLAADGHSAEITHFSDRGSQAQQSAGSLPHLIRTQGYTLPAPGAYAVLARRLSAQPADLVHAQLPVSPLDFLLPRLTRELRIPLIGTFHHGWDYRPTKFGLVGQAVARAYAPALARYDRVIVFGPRLQREFTKLGVAEERLAVVPNGVDVQEYRPGASEYRLADKLRVTYMGRMSPDKNVQELVETFVAAARPELVLTLVGAGPLYAGLHARYGQHPGLHFVGFVADAEERKSIWRGTDVVVLPSPIEGLSLSLLEGMASGCMPVATDVGEHESVLEGVGLTMDPRTVKTDLAAAWQQLAADRQAVAAAGRAAREHVVKHFSAELHWQRLRAVYDSVVEQRPVRGA